MKRTWLYLVLAGIVECANAAAPREADVRVPDVIAAFNALTHHGEWLGFRLRPTDSILPGPDIDPQDYTGKTHYQGVQRWQAPGLGAPFMFVARAGVKSDDRAELLIVRMGSREPFGERLRSNRLQTNKITNVTFPPPNDAVVTNWTFSGWHHAGSIQLVGDILAVPLEDPHDNRGSEIGKVVFLDMSDPLNPTQLGYTLDISGHKAGVVGITRLQDGYLLLVLAWGANEKLEFYRSTRKSFFEPGFEFIKHDEWDGSELIGGTWRSGTPACYQSLSLVCQSDGRVFMIGARNTSQGSPIINGEDVMGAFEILGYQIGPITNVQVVAMAGEDHKYCSSPGSVSNPVRGSTAGINANFLASSGTYVSPSGELLFYATEHWTDGPGHTVRMAEFRHQFMGRAGNPLPTKIANAGDKYEVGEGGTVLLDGSHSRPPVLKPWIELFEHDDFDGRSVVMDWPDRDRDSYEDFRDDLEDFNDKASSVRWWAPAGWIIQLHNQNDLGTEETILQLICNGSVQSLADLGSFDNDTTSVQFIPPANNTVDSPLTYSWTPINPPANAGHLLSQTGAQVTFQAGDGERFDVRLDVGPAPVSSNSTRIYITNVPPAVAGITITSYASQTGRVDLVVNFTDPGANDLHNLRIQWGDGATSNLVSSTPVRSFTSSHVYPNSDPLASNRLTFTLSLRLRDLDGGEVNTNRNVTVTFYDPASTADSDADGLPDTWEDFYFGDRKHMGSADSDGDGQSNQAEYVAGTDPMDSTDALRLGIRSLGPTNEVSFFGQRTQGAGYGTRKRYYTLECSTNLTTPSWRVVGAVNNVPAADAMIGLLQLREAHDAMRFYRVRAALDVIPAVAGLKHWWRGEDNGLDGFGPLHRFSVSAGYTNGVVGRAYWFNGIDDEASLPTGVSVSTAWTAAFWVYRQDAFPGNSAALLMDSVSALKAEQAGTSRRVGFTHFGPFGTQQNYSFNYTIPAQTWTHVVFVSLSGNTQLFVNGNLQDTVNDTIPLPLRTLGGEDGYRFRGRLDEVGVYNRALTADEVQLLHAIESGN